MKKIIARTLLGAPIGITIGYLITVVISVTMGGGEYYPCVPGFADTVGSEINAVVIQTLLCAVMGGGFGAASLIWEEESWSIARQTGTAFAAYSLLMLPAAYIAQWMEHSVAGVLSYFGIFAASFVFVWLVQFAAWKIRINKINSRIRH